jgi:hypothetical protein
MSELDTHMRVTLVDGRSFRLADSEAEIWALIDPSTSSDLDPPDWFYLDVQDPSTTVRRLIVPALSVLSFEEVAEVEDVRITAKGDTSADATADSRNPVPVIRCRFVPQGYRDPAGKRIVEVDPRGETEWIASKTWVRVLMWRLGDDFAKVYERGWEADAFKDDPSAPEWVRNWDGPFEIDVANASEEL